MAVDNKKLTGIMIHGFAVAHAGTAFALAQTVVGDTAALTGLTIAMIVSISMVNGANWSISKGFAFLGVYAGTYFGTMGAVTLIKWIPGLGNVANAAVSFTLTEVMGWATYLIIKQSSDPKNIDPKSLSKEEIKKIMEIAKGMQKAETEEMKRLYDSMEPEEKAEFGSIMKQLKNRELPEETRKYLIGRIETISSKYAKGSEA